MASVSTLSEDIDRLLEHYLELLDQHTSLRTQLSTLQSSVHQHLARANFSAERGIRYGADFYDARMQATRVCRITVPTLPESGSGSRTTALPSTQPSVDVEPHTAATSEHESSHERDTLKHRDLGTACFTISSTPEPETDQEKPARPATGEGTAEDDSREHKTKSVSKDPIRMFGFMVPQSLRQAQSVSITCIEGIVPKIVSVDAEMKELEVQIRRARKYKLKAEKKEQGNPNHQGVGMKELAQAIEAS